MSYLYLKRPGQLPWGYRECADDPQLIEPIEEQLDLLKEAMKYLDYCSYMETSKWLSAKSGRSISHAALFQIKKSDFDKRYPSTPTIGTTKEATKRDCVKQSGRPKGARTSYKKLLANRRRKEAESRKKAKANPEGEERTIIHRKCCLAPRATKRTLRERRLKPYPNNL